MSLRNSRKYTAIWAITRVATGRIADSRCPLTLSESGIQPRSGNQSSWNTNTCFRRNPTTNAGIDNPRNARMFAPLSNTLSAL